MFYVEIFTGYGWQRVSSAISDYYVAQNVLQSLALRSGQGTDNFSILYSEEDK